MTIYISNVNGDWWVYNPNQPLYILDSETISPDDIADINEAGGFEGDKFEDVIQEYGYVVPIDVTNTIWRKP